MKKIVLKLFNFYIKSSIHVALSVVSLAFISVKLSQNDVLISMLIFIFCSALFAYNFIKFSSIIWEIKKHNFPYLIFCLSLICLIVSIHFFLNLTLSAKIIAMIGGILVVLYTLPLNNEMSNLRNIKGWKVYLVTLTWILLTTVIPFASTLIFEIKLFVQLLLIQSIYIFVAILPFDIHDLNYDSRNLNTLPQQLGVSRVKILGYVLLIINCIITILCFGFCHQ